MDDLNKTGVYAITNTVNGKRYVGSAATSFTRRWTQHRHKLRHNNHENKYLQTSWNKHGEVAFKFEVLVNCPPADCLRLEQSSIDNLRAMERDFGYNLTPVAGSMLGFRHSAETCAAISRKNKGIKRSEKFKADLAFRLKGKKRSPETIAKMKIGMKAAMTPERRAAQSARNLARTPEQLAVIHAAAKTPEALAKKSAKIKGRKFSTEIAKKMMAARWAGDARAKMSAVHKGKKLSPEHIAKCVAGRKGLIVDDVTKLKMKISRLNFLRKPKIESWFLFNLGMSPSEIDWEIAI